MSTPGQRNASYLPKALRLASGKFLYRFLLSACFFILILFALALGYSGVSIFILLLINIAFCADIFGRCAWKDVWRARVSFSVLISLSVLAGFIYCALSTFFVRASWGPAANLYGYISFLLTLALWMQYRMTCAWEKTNVFIKKLDDFLPKSGRLYTKETYQKVFARELQVGQRVWVRPGERVPCDGTIVEGKTFLDEQLISGNIRSTAKETGDFVYAGTLNKTQAIGVQVETPLAASAIVEVLDSIKNSEQYHHQKQDSLEKSAPWLTLGLVLAGAIAGWYMLSLPGPGSGLRALGAVLLIFTLGCPAGWLFSTILPSFFICYGAKKIGLTLNCLSTLETLVQADTVFLDKTGTLTQGALRLSGVFAAKGYQEKDVLEVLLAAEQWVEDAFSQAVLNYLPRKAITVEPVQSTEVFPGQGVLAKTKKEIILAGRAAWLKENGVRLPSVQTGAQSVIFVARAGKYVGYVTLEDCLRTGAQDLISLLKEKNKEIILISGDTQSSVQAVAHELKIEKFNFGVLPKTKAEVITNLRALGKRVVMVGDGFNDIIALLKADGGIVFSSVKNVYNHWVDIVVDRPDLYAVADLFRIERRWKYITWENIGLAVGIQTLVIAVLLSGKVAWLGTWQAGLASTLGVVLLILLNSMRLLKLK